MSDKHVTLSYPGLNGNPEGIVINLEHVRASDGIRVSYDFYRDGWVIKQPFSDAEYGEPWAEVAFVKSWQLVDLEYD